MSRRKFIESLGGTCANWRNSWSFVNHEREWVIFGAWGNQEIEQGQVILQDSWERTETGKKGPSYKQSRSHIDLILSGYALFTFEMAHKVANPMTGSTTAAIKSFKPEIAQKLLVRQENSWIAIDLDLESNVQQEVLLEGGLFPEGSIKTISVKAYERSAHARGLCLAHHGFKCKCCEVDLVEIYGERARNRIHVHHTIPASKKMPRGHKTDPIRDLVPVCPNCHFFIHMQEPMLSIDEVQKALISTREAKLENSK